MTALAGAFAAFNRSYVLRQYQQSPATWLERITEQTPGAVATPARDPLRRQVVAQSDGTFGVGWSAPDPYTGATRMGYIPHPYVTVGVNKAHQVEQMTVDGRLDYEQWPLLLYTPDLTIAKGDVLALPDGTRYVVADEVGPPAQVYGAPTLKRARLEPRQSGDLIYSIPLT